MKTLITDFERAVASNNKLELSKSPLTAECRYWAMLCDGIHLSPCRPPRLFINLSRVLYSDQMWPYPTSDETDRPESHLVPGTSITLTRASIIRSACP